MGRGMLSSRTLGFLQGDEYSKAAELADEPGELSPHAGRLADRDRPGPWLDENGRRLAPSEWLAGLGEDQA